MHQDEVLPLLSYPPSKKKENFLLFRFTFASGFVNYVIRDKTGLRLSLGLRGPPLDENLLLSSITTANKKVEHLSEVGNNMWWFVVSSSIKKCCRHCAREKAWPRMCCKIYEPINRPNRLTQCCTQFKPSGNKTLFQVFPYHLNMNATLSCTYNTQRILVQGDQNSPFPSCCMPQFQSESWCTTIQMEMNCELLCKSNSFPLQ